MPPFPGLFPILVAFLWLTPLASVRPKNCFAANFSNFFAEKILEDETFWSSVAY